MNYLVDSSVCLRLVSIADPLHGVTSAALKRVVRDRKGLFITAQVVAECWNVLTRPSASNGYGMDHSSARSQIAQITSTCIGVDDPSGMVNQLASYAERHQVSGRQIHDARLALTCELLGLDGIITYNKGDFARYTGIRALEPVELSSPSA